MIELITNLNKISSLLNLNAKKKFTLASVGYDSYNIDGPKIAKLGNKKYLFACHLEKGNIMAQKDIEKTMPQDIEAVYYNPFFTFDKENTTVYTDFVTALKKTIPGNIDIALDPTVPVSIYKSLSNVFNVFFQEKETDEPYYYQYLLSKKEVMEKFDFWRSQADATAMKLIEHSNKKCELEKFIRDRKDSRFEVLDLFMRDKKIDAVFCTSPLSVQEITGYGLQNYQENQFASLYTGEESVVLFSRQPIEKFFGKWEKVNIFSAISQKIGSNAVLGIEECHCPMSLYKKLEGITQNIKDCMFDLRKSREIRGWEDLSYYIIASRSTAYAIEGALEWTKNKICDGESITELDVEKKYYTLLQLFKEKNCIPFDINAMLTICSAGNRGSIPSLPTKHSIDTNINSLKLDAGVSVLDSLGIHHAASDITRTLVLQNKTEKAYKKLEKFMIENVIPNVKPNMKGKDIYRLAVSKIEDNKDVFKEADLLSYEIQNFEDIFNRNVGHLMGLQEPVTLFFLKNSQGEIKSGMIAAIEYQWHSNGFGIGIEDNFIVGNSGGLNYSRD